MRSKPGFGVIFDMDGVLVDSADAHFHSWQLLVEKCGGSITRDQFASTFGRQNRDIVPILFGDVDNARLQSLADRKEAIYRDLIREHPPIVKGASSLIHALHENGIRMAIGSSGPRENIQLIVSAMGAADSISVIVSGDDVTRGKPDPQVFALAADRLGLCPEQCVVIEDAPVGIQAARAAGAHTVAVLLYHSAEALADADCTVARLADLTVEKTMALARNDDATT